MPNRHSGLVLVTCADWAYHVHHRERVLGSGMDPFTEHLWSLVDKIPEEFRVDVEALRHDLTVWAQDARRLRAASAGSPSRLAEMIHSAAHHPMNPDHILPHILRVEAPALVVGDPLRRAAFIMLNPTVLAGAHTVLVDGHSNCAGIAANCKGQFWSDQWDLQRGLMEKGGQDFANQLAINRHGDVMVIITYTEYGQPGEVLNTRDIREVKNTVVY